ncbi:hypothetical protein CORC01_11039 [Colletotrichum orchidophilum]|uniref:Uncharacterized protein n=1 Tax=Colletotrichum orchidophilum TaxID=1209926 RepID=A0A1G4AWZ1_9PEZI|nr:uncharacterized protein CORC01_11039 [Colletotrichum orchidophilum]OHE93636.1 hypothetical protein CORC01_11039 [Colletotrichum orchidophilum]
MCGLESECVETCHLHLMPRQLMHHLVQVANTSTITVRVLAPRPWFVYIHTRPGIVRPSSYPGLPPSPVSSSTI